MELWIRSQSKYGLVKSNGIYIKEDFVAKNGLKWCIYNYDDNLVAYYDTKERCLEILDEIQNLICLLNKHGELTSKEQIEQAVCYLPNENKTLPYCKVYQMPKK